MVGMYCAVSSCKNKLLNRKTSKPNVTFHRFPSDLRLREIWTERCNRGKDWKKQNVFMCSDHFAPSDFHLSDPAGKERQRVKLVKGALPTRNLPGVNLEPKSESEEAESNIVILEVSSVGGKHSTKLIDPPTKRAKLETRPEDVSLARTEDQLPRIEDQRPLAEDRPIKVPCEGSNPLPVLVKKGDAVQLMYLHTSPDIKPSASTTSNFASQISSKQNTGTSPDCDASQTLEPRTNPGSTGDLLVDRLQQRIRELEEKIIIQRDKCKNKIKAIQLKCSNDVSELRGQVRELKMEVRRFNKMHSTMLKRGIVPPVSWSKLSQSDKISPSISTEMQRVLGRYFTHNQIKAMLNETNLIRWTHSELLNAYTLRHLSYGAYTFVRNTLKFPLPSPKYLTQWASKIQKDKEAGIYSPVVGIGAPPQGESDYGSDKVDDLSDSVAYGQSTDVIVEQPSGSPCGSEFGLNCEDFPDDNQIVIIQGPSCNSDNSSNFEMPNQSKDASDEVYSPPDPSITNRTEQSGEVNVSNENSMEGSEAEQTVS